MIESNTQQQQQDLTNLLDINTTMNITLTNPNNSILQGSSITTTPILKQKKPESSSENKSIITPKISNENSERIRIESMRKNQQYDDMTNIISNENQNGMLLRLKNQSINNESSKKIKTELTTTRNSDMILNRHDQSNRRENKQLNMSSNTKTYENIDKVILEPYSSNVVTPLKPLTQLDKYSNNKGGLKSSEIKSNIKGSGCMNNKSNFDLKENEKSVIVVKSNKQSAFQDSKLSSAKTQNKSNQYESITKVHKNESDMILENPSLLKKILANSQKKPSKEAISVSDGLLQNSANKQTNNSISKELDHALEQKLLTMEAQLLEAPQHESKISSNEPVTQIKDQYTSPQKPSFTLASLNSPLIEGIQGLSAGLFPKSHPRDSLFHNSIHNTPNGLNGDTHSEASDLLSHLDNQASMLFTDIDNHNHNNNNNNNDNNNIQHEGILNDLEVIKELENEFRAEESRKLMENDIEIMNNENKPIEHDENNNTNTNTNYLETNITNKTENNYNNQQYNHDDEKNLIKDNDNTNNNNNNNDHANDIQDGISIEKTDSMFVNYSSIVDSSQQITKTQPDSLFIMMNNYEDKKESNNDKMMCIEDDTNAIGITTQSLCHLPINEIKPIQNSDQAPGITPKSYTLSNAHALESHSLRLMEKSSISTTPSVPSGIIKDNELKLNDNKANRRVFMKKPNANSMNKLITKGGSISESQKINLGVFKKSSIKLEDDKRTTFEKRKSDQTKQTIAYNNKEGVLANKTRNSSNQTQKTDSIINQNKPSVKSNISSIGERTKSNTSKSTEKVNPPSLKRKFEMINIDNTNKQVKKLKMTPLPETTISSSSSLTQNPKKTSKIHIEVTKPKENQSSTKENELKAMNTSQSEHFLKPEGHISNSEEHLLKLEKQSTVLKKLDTPKCKSYSGPNSGSKENNSNSLNNCIIANSDGKRSKSIRDMAKKPGAPILNNLSNSNINDFAKNTNIRAKSASVSKSTLTKYISCGICHGLLDDKTQIKTFICTHKFHISCASKLNKGNIQCRICNSNTAFNEVPKPITFNPKVKKIKNQSLEFSLNF